MRSRRYGSDLTDAQWQSIAPLLAHQRFLKHHPRSLLDALFYLTKTGCPTPPRWGGWRYLPDTYPPWQTVYYHFRRWAESGLLTRLTHRLRRAVRRKAGRAESPSAAIIDSQSVKTSHVGGERGFDGGKLVKGRKRHILTDTLGLLLAVLVHRADINDSQRAPHLLDRAQGEVPRLEAVFADEGYAATPAGLIWRVFGWAWHVVEGRRISGGSSCWRSGGWRDRPRSRADARVVRRLPPALEGLRGATGGERGDGRAQRDPYDGPPPGIVTKQSLSPLARS